MKKVERRLERIPKHPGIYRILVLNSKSGIWEEPKHGGKFQVCRDEGTRDGKRWRPKQNFRSFAEAKACRYRSQELIKSTIVLEDASSKPSVTFLEVLRIWCEKRLPEKDLSTQIRYKSYLQHFKFFSNLEMEKIGPADIHHWLDLIRSPDYLAKGHPTRCSYNHEFSVLRGIFSFYCEMNRNYRLPFHPDHRKRLKVRNRIFTASKDLKIEEFRAFLRTLKEVCEECNSEVIYFLALMQYATYTRIQEAAALWYEDFDFERSKVTINKKVQWLRARGYKSRVVGGGKANGGKELDLTSLASRAFKEWVMKTGIRSGPLFQKGGQIITYRQIEYRYSQALRRAGLPFTATHILRHASLTEFYDTCKDLLATQKVAGHGDLRSTQKYAKVRDETVLKAQKEMDIKLSSIAP